MEIQNVGRILKFNLIDMKLLKPLNYRPNVYKDLFQSSILQLNEHDVSLKFDDEFYTAKSILDFLDSLGFNSLDNGYRYLLCIFNHCVNNSIIPKAIKSMYELCSEKYSISVKSVEIAIISSINSAINYGNLIKFNDIFGCDKIVGDHISNGTFIMSVCQRFILSKAYNRPIEFTT